MDPAGLYREVVIAHNRAPRRFAPLAHATHAGRGANPACGDDLAVQLRVVDGRIDELGFGGEGCAVAIATASMLGDALAGAGPAKLAALRADFARLLAGDAAAEGLGELRALSGLQAHPARHRCAWLAFEAVEDALARGGR
jgi:nitrogen fixation protein NifU and related proteins